MSSKTTDHDRKCLRYDFTVASSIFNNSFFTQTSDHRIDITEKLYRLLSGVLKEHELLAKGDRKKHIFNANTSHRSKFSLTFLPVAARHLETQGVTDDQIKTHLATTILKLAKAVLKNEMPTDLSLVFETFTPDPQNKPFQTPQTPDQPSHPNTPSSSTAPSLSTWLTGLTPQT